MSRVDGQDPRDRELERLLAQAGRPTASPAFRSRLKERFVGAVEEGAEGAAEPAPRTMVPHRTRIFPFVWPFVLAASVAFILHYVLSRDANVRWRVVGTDGGGEYVIDGRRMHASETARLADAVQTAQEIETFNAGLRLKLADDLLLELAPKTRVSQLSFPPAHIYSIYANAGSLRITTGPGFTRNRLRVMTDDMETAVVGTTFGVDIDGEGTCLCCLDGTVKTDPRSGQGMQPTEAGKMCFAFHTGKKALWGDAVQQHVEPLRELRSFAAALWKSR